MRSTNRHPMANGLRSIAIWIMGTIEFAVSVGHHGFHNRILDDSIVYMAQKNVRKCVLQYNNFSPHAILITMQLLHQIRIVLAVRSPGHFVSNSKEELLQLGTQFWARPETLMSV